ncbi:MAG TPA: GntR family transcriptional regulator [Burkholderiales bacterium]|nr:GntR family transcriptional regulator [Burkholderiales bacterium]
MNRIRKSDIVRTLRQRILRALQIGAVMPGDRLPSTRELAAEMTVDARAVAAAYRELENDGLVEMRRRSGVFVAKAAKTWRSRPLPSVPWMADVLAAGIARGVPVSELPELFAMAFDRGRIRAAVIATSRDQADGLQRELQEDFGLDVRTVLGELIEPRRPLPRAIHRAHLLVSTEALATQVGALAARLGKTHIKLTVRFDLFETEWGALRGLDAFVLVSDAHFGTEVRNYLAGTGAADRVRVLTIGIHDLTVIPPDAIVYATQAARKHLGRTRMPAGLLPPARVISEQSARAVLEAMLSLRRR